jgi:hypothetical protein
MEHICSDALILSIFGLAFLVVVLVAATFVCAFILWLDLTKQSRIDAVQRIKEEKKAKRAVAIEENRLKKMISELEFI